MSNFFGCGPWRSRLPYDMSIVQLKVHMDCEGCEKKVRRAISKLNGVDELEIDMEKQKVTVTGHVDKRKVLRTVKRTGRKAEYWPFPYDSENYPYASQYMHGYNESDHRYYQFSDENVHAPCSIM